MQLAERRLEEQSVQPALGSELGKWLKQEWAWGRISPQMRQKIASLAIADMVAACGLEAIPQDLQRLATLGSSGAHPNNVHRDPCFLFCFSIGFSIHMDVYKPHITKFITDVLVVHIKDVSLLPEPERVVLPLKIAAGAAFQSIMLPHMVFHSLYSLLGNHFLAWRHQEAPSILDQNCNPPHHGWALFEIQRLLAVFRRMCG